MSHANLPDLEYVGSGVSFGSANNPHNASPCFGRGRPVVPGHNECTVDQSVINPQFVPVANSTPVPFVNSQPTHVSHEALSGLISDLAKQIGDNITAKMCTVQQASHSQEYPANNASPTLPESPHVKVVVQSEAKAPPFFRGDSSDTFSIQEWEDLMRCYLSRANCGTPEEQYGLLMSRLTGKARDVVKVSLRCRPELCGAGLINAVFNVLKHHFSELTCSNLPMRDFYGTVPRTGEDAMDYWIRLNKTIDAVDECLHRRGKCVEDPHAEVVMMFISHCPDPTLSLSFQMKPAEQWTVAEVQQRLDGRVRTVKSIVANTQAVDGADTLHDPVASPQPTGACSVATIEPVSQQMVTMFDRVLSLCNASLATGHQRAGRSQVPRRTQPLACRVCGSSEHSTHSHCRLYRLCLNCFEPGHVKRDCRQEVGQRSSNAASHVDLN
ncbi:uncharacterized protein LOC114135654 [Xiphophorus couchianus]|uniref:uncharacterized protein LOC114135654 n=1 Tax=Xiphophorus couchianus TaxID=32473 RepID=UPI001015EBA4|nr:uncharacterized protein LOC114135654 [Xiphophorus couchianus]